MAAVGYRPPIQWRVDKDGFRIPLTPVELVDLGDHPEIISSSADLAKIRDAHPKKKIFSDYVSDVKKALSKPHPNRPRFGHRLSISQNPSPPPEEEAEKNKWIMIIAKTAFDRANESSKEERKT